MTELQDKMIREFQCPGCTCGSSPDSGCFKKEDSSMACGNHSAGTSVSRIGCINLGLPKGFNRNGPVDKSCQHSIIRLHEKSPEYDKFNIPAWAITQDGFVFVRCYLPRKNITYVDVYPGIEIPEGSINVGEFINEID